MVFIFFGPTPDSWAIGNDHFSLAQNLPSPIQKVWDQLGSACTDQSMAGTMISWISSSLDGSYAIMTKHGELLSNRQDLLTIAYPQHLVEHVAISPHGGLFIRFTDGSVQLSSLRNFPPAFHSLGRNHINTDVTARQPHSPVRRVFFGADGGVIISTNHGLLSDSFSEPVNASIRNLTHSDVSSASFSLGKNTAFCPWNSHYHVIEAESEFDTPRYLHLLPPNQLLRGLVESVLSNQWPRPPPLQTAAGATVASCPAMSQMSPESRALYDGLFNSNSGGKAYLTGIEAAVIFTQSGLGQADLSRIWEQADLNQDGRFNREEFFQAMRLIELQTGGNCLQLDNPNSRPSYNGEEEFLKAYSPHYFPPPPQYHPTPPQNPVVQPYNPAPPLYHAASVQPWQAHVVPDTKTLELSTAMICSGCDVGFVPEDILYHCESCKAGTSSYCEKCHESGKECEHNVPRAKLEQSKKLPIKDKNGSSGFGIKCDGCKAKIKKGSLLWYCRRCFDPYFCQDCWRRSDKRCKHASKGKITLKLVEKDPKGDGDWDAFFEGVGEVLIG